MSCERPRPTASRVRIDPPGAGDEDAVIAANRAARAYHAPYTRPCTDHAAFAAWLENAAHPANRSFIAREIESKALVAVLNLTQIAMGNFCSAYLGYHGYPQTGGCGLVAEGMTLMLDEAFGKIGLHRIEANIQPGNAKSIGLVARCGFRKEGYSPRYLMIDGKWRDHERWAITVEDWRA